MEKKMIKKTLALCTVLCAPHSALAQDNIGKIGMISGNAGIQYERSLTDRFSLLGQVGNSTIDTAVNGVESTSSGVGFVLEARYYFSSNKDLMEGWHIGPYLNSINTKNDRDEKIDITSIGLSLGYQFVFESRITAEVVFGGGSLDLQTDQQEVEFLNDFGFFPHFGFSVGYSF